MEQKSLQSLPKGWGKTTLSGVALWGSGGTPSRKNSDFFKGSIPWVKTGELGPKYIRSAEEHITQEAILKSSAKVFPPGSVGIAMYGATIGKLSIWAENLSVNQACAVAQPHQKLCSSEFLYYFLLSQKHALIEVGIGGAQPNISQGILKAWPVCLPPISEQQRIVAKIEELFSELDKGIDSLKTARAQLNVYRQAVLKHAFEGKLTAQWREQNKDKLESPEQMLARIKRERVAHYERQLHEWRTAVKEWDECGKSGNRPSKPRKLTELPLLGAAELASFPPSPQGHAYTYLANLGELGRGKSKHRPRNALELFGGPYPFIQTGAVKAAGRVIHKYTQTYSDIGLEQSKLWPKGTLCITIAANIAETAFLGFDGCFPDSVVGFTATKTLVLPEYVELFIKSVRTRIEAYAPATAQKNINLTTLENLVVPLCSLQEQQVLVDELESVLSVLEEQNAEIDNQLLKAVALRQSILKKAFTGQLVAQDPNDEPASLLLERIRAEKLAQSRDTTTPKRRRRAMVKA